MRMPYGFLMVVAFWLTVFATMVLGEKQYGLTSDWQSFSFFVLLCAIAYACGRLDKGDGQTDDEQRLNQSAARREDGAAADKRETSTTGRA